MPTKPRRPRDPAKEKLWRRIIRRHQQSDLSVRAFCQDEGLKVCNFLWWRRELNRRDREKAGFLPDPSTEAPAETPASHVFLPVRVVDAEFAPPRPAPPIEIVLNGGPTVRVPIGCVLRLRPDVCRSRRDRGRVLGSRPEEVLRITDLRAGAGSRGVGAHPAALDLPDILPPSSQAAASPERSTSQGEPRLPSEEGIPAAREPVGPLNSFAVGYSTYLALGQPRY